MRVAVVGGGPAGLYFARLFAQSQPRATIDLFERGREGATWGFGVGLGGQAMLSIQASDPEVHHGIVDAMRFTHEQVIRLNNEAFTLRYDEPTGAIARLDLLRILTNACRAVGVALHFESSIVSADDLADYDLVVAADGAGSGLRTEHEDDFGTSRRTLTNRFAWFGIEKSVPMGLVFRTYDEGAFVGHHYSYAPNMSTFVAECDEATWHRFQLEKMADDERKALMERVFAPELHGQPLVDNRSIWRRFPAVTNAHYRRSRTVLLGDSLRVAHFSIGSGTRLALEDAAALHLSLAEQEGSIEDGLARFERRRRPERDKLGEAARRSFEWYERVADHMAQPILPFIHSFLTRTGRIDDRRLQTYAPDFYQAYQHYKSRMVH